MKKNINNIDIIIPNFKKYFSGVTTTVARIVPIQITYGTNIATVGIKLKDIPFIKIVHFLFLWKKPKNHFFRIWHARRNIEMIIGIIMRDILCMKIRLIFTSASQREHKFFTRFLISRMNKVIAVSEKSAAYLNVKYNIITHGVDTSHFKRYNKIKSNNVILPYNLNKLNIIGCFGRIRFQKGTDLFVESMIYLLKIYTDWIAIIVGRTTLKNYFFKRQLQKKIFLSGLSEKIIFFNEVSNIEKWYELLTIYVAPSRNEGFGLTPLEAMSSEVAVVASDAGYYPEIIKKGTGKIFLSNDKTSIKNSIEYYMKNPKKAIIHGKNARKYVKKNFSIIKEAKSINKIYKEILHK